MAILYDPNTDYLARTCLCWQLVRADGVRVLLTEHDAVITVDGDQFLPGASMETSSFTATNALEAGHANVEGALISDALNEDDIAGGKWDHARVEVFRADWHSGERLHHVWSGRFSEIVRSGNSFRGQLVSLKVDLDLPVGRSFGRMCEANLGDERCGVDLEDPAFSGKSCDQRFATCQSVFANAENFQGFPHMPGTDFVLAGPGAGTAT